MKTSSSGGSSWIRREVVDVDDDCCEGLWWVSVIGGLGCRRSMNGTSSFVDGGIAAIVGVLGGIVCDGVN